MNISDHVFSLAECLTWLDVENANSANIFLSLVTN